MKHSLSAHISAQFNSVPEALVLHFLANEEIGDLIECARTPLVSCDGVAMLSPPDDPGQYPFFFCIPDVPNLLARHVGLALTTFLGIDSDRSRKAIQFPQLGGSDVLFDAKRGWVIPDPVQYDTILAVAYQSLMIEIRGHVFQEQWNLRIDSRSSQDLVNAGAISASALLQCLSAYQALMQLALEDELQAFVECALEQQDCDS